jgi:hypothetical protein
MKFHSQRISGRMVAAVLALAPLAVAWADPVQKPAASASKAPQTAPAATSPRKPLDLRAPELNRVFSRSDLETLTSKPDDVSEGAETVAVEGARHDRIIAPSGLRGLAWGVRHPTQAWRLFVPSPSE